MASDRRQDRRRNLATTFYNERVWVLDALATRIKMNYRFIRMELTPEKLRLIPMVVLIVIGCFGLLNSKTVMRSLFSLDVIDTATISIFVLIAASSGSQTPIVSSFRYNNYSDPYPQAIILTAIVIGFASQALLCAIALRLGRRSPLLRYRDLEK